MRQIFLPVYYLWQLNLPVKGKVANLIAMNDFDTILDRIKQETGIKSMRQLAEVIGIKHQTISAAKKKGEFSVSWAYYIAGKYGLLTEWIMSGKGPKRLNEEGAMNPLLIDVNEWLNEEGKHKDAEFRIVFRRQMIRAFFDYEAWVKKRKMPLDDVAKNPITKVA